MPQADKPKTPNLKVTALRRIRLLLDRPGLLHARDAGLTEDEFVELANEQLIEIHFDADEGPVFDRYYIDSILPKGELILADDALAAPDPLRVAVVPHHKSVGTRIFEGTRSGVWDLIKVAFGVVLGFLLKKYWP